MAKQATAIRRKQTSPKKQAGGSSQKAIRPTGKFRDSRAHHLFGSMPQTKLESYSAALLRAIRRELGDATFFTREDCIHLALLNHVSTMYRYSMVCVLLRFLEQKGEVIIKSRTNIILKGDHEKSYSEIPLSQQHYDRIFSIIRSMVPQSHTTVMDIVSLWTTDPHLTINNKRVAVRGAINRLVKGRLLRRHDDFQFIVLRRSNRQQEA